jgi:magnesium transporter
MRRAVHTSSRVTSFHHCHSTPACYLSPSKKPEQKVLKAYRYVDGKLAGTDPSTDPEGSQNAIWYDLLNPEPEDFAFTVRQTGLDLPETEDIVEIENSSRLSNEGDVLTLTMPIVTRTPEGMQASACAFVLAPDRLVTIRLAPSLVFDHFIEQPHLSCLSPAASLFTGLLEAIVDRQADALENLRHGLDQLSHEIFHHRFAGTKNDVTIRGRNTEAQLQETLVTIGRDYDAITYLRDSQLGVGRIATYVQASAAWIPAPVMVRLDALNKDIASLNEFSTHLTDKVQFLLDATLGLINIAQNSLIKVLTIVSIVGIPPTLIAGIYGMNFVNIPELHWTYGYAYAWAIMLLTAVLPLAWFRKKGWV